MGNRDNTNFGLEYLKGLYTNTTLETKEPQPFYILARDTIKAFLHEKLELIQQKSMFVAYLGIEITIVIALLTSTFRDIWIIKSNLIQGTFLAFWIILGFLIIKSAITSLGNYKTLKVDKLTTDLGEKGTVIKPESIKQNKDNLIIISAKYFTSKKSLDVTQMLNSKIVDNKLELIISNENFGNNDPDPGTLKQFSIEYELNEIIYNRTLNEGDKLIIP